MSLTTATEDTLRADQRFSELAKMRTGSKPSPTTKLLRGELWEAYAPDHWQGGQCPHYLGRSTGAKISRRPWPANLNSKQMQWVVSHTREIESILPLVNESITRMQSVDRAWLLRSVSQRWVNPGAIYPLATKVYWRTGYFSGDRECSQIARTSAYRNCLKEYAREEARSVLYASNEDRLGCHSKLSYIEEHSNKLYYMQGNMVSRVSYKALSHEMGLLIEAYREYEKMKGRTETTILNYFEPLADLQERTGVTASYWLDGRERSVDVLAQLPAL